MHFSPSAQRGKGATLLSFDKYILFFFFKSTQMHMLPSLLIISSLLYHLNRAVPLRTSISLIPATNRSTTTIPAPHNNPNSSTNYLGVECYHLAPDTVDLLACQPLFARLFRDGRAYEEMSWGNGFRFRSGGEPCVVTLSSPDRKDRVVSISKADVVLYATEVLESCETGGASTFERGWRVAVTRFPVFDGAG